MTAPSLLVTHGDGRNVPRLACAGCGDLIADVREAGVVWPPDGWLTGEAPHFAVPVLCKGRHCLARDPRWHQWPWMPLGHYLVWLLENSGGHPPARLRALIADARRMADLGG
jgi:hypothetical protein